MKIPNFVMERWQSKWENVVDYNLSESGVQPIPVKELVSRDALDEILNTKLGYVQTDGTPQLKELISRIYPRSDSDNILVTTGSSEANFLSALATIEPGDEAIFMLPNYMQLHGLSRSLGAKVKTFYLREDLDWNPDPDELKKLVTKKTKIICITNPNNPTGGQLSSLSRQTIIDLAERADAWIISDEVYQGAELDSVTTPSFWGEYKKVIVTCGLSKAFGLPGLRIGWVAGPKDLIEKAWAYKDYTTISLSTLSDWIGRIVLTPENRMKILQRTRRIVQSNFPILRDWLDNHKELFHCTPPRAGAIAFVRYNFAMNSSELTERLREMKSVLVCPGDHFGMDGYMRFGYGEEKDYLIKGLSLVEEGLKEIMNAGL